jgi:hypothetical protein
MTQQEFTKEVQRIRCSQETTKLEYNDNIYIFENGIMTGTRYK